MALGELIRCLEIDECCRTCGEDIQQLLCFCPNLRSLNIKSSFEDTFWVSNCSHLHRLFIRIDCPLDDDAVAQLAESTGGLEVLNFALVCAQTQYIDPACNKFLSHVTITIPLHAFSGLTYEDKDEPSLFRPTTDEVATICKIVEIFTSCAKLWELSLGRIFLSVA